MGGVEQFYRLRSHECAIDDEPHTHLQPDAIQLAGRLGTPDSTP